jgi:hypothetical protein
MRRAAALASAVFVLASASAGAGTPRPPLALTAAPARVALTRSDEVTIRVANPGSNPVVVDVARAGFALDLRGRPRIVDRREALRAAAAWLTVRPTRLLVPAGATRGVAIASRLPGRGPGPVSACG